MKGNKPFLLLQGGSRLDNTEELLEEAQAQRVGGGDCTIRRLDSASGGILLTDYPVFSGITLTYMDVHAVRCGYRPAQESGLLTISHCREGRIEYRCGESYYFLSQGDLAVMDGSMTGAAHFPTGHYHGITVTLDTRRAPDCLSCILQDVNVRPDALAEKFCAGSGYFVARSSESVAHIFSELYAVPDGIRKGYFKVKLLELLLFLSALEVQHERRSYTSAQVRLAGEVGEYLLQNVEKEVTIAALAARFGVSPSQLSASFRGAYGMTPAAFLRAQKMHSAARLLRTTDRTVLDIAGQFGYDNASKFARAFRSIIGVAPNAYRLGVDRDSCAPAQNF